MLRLLGFPKSMHLELLTLRAINKSSILITFIPILELQAFLIVSIDHKAKEHRNFYKSNFGVLLSVLLQDHSQSGILLEKRYESHFFNNLFLGIFLTSFLLYSL